MARVEPIEYLVGRFFVEPQKMVRVSTILKKRYRHMFATSYDARIVRCTECGWQGRWRVLMDIPEKYLGMVSKFSSTNKYKKAYRLIWD